MFTNLKHGGNLIAPRRGLSLRRHVEPEPSLHYRQVEAQFARAGFNVDRSGPNSHGEYLVSTWKAGKVGPAGTGTTIELAINDAWTQYVGDRRAYD